MDEREERNVRSEKVRGEKIEVKVEAREGESEK